MADTGTREDNEIITIRLCKYVYSKFRYFKRVIRSDFKVLEGVTIQ
jgi:hypothetical protein